MRWKGKGPFKVGIGEDLVNWIGIPIRAENNSLEYHWNLLVHKCLDM